MKHQFRSLAELVTNLLRKLITYCLGITVYIFQNLLTLFRRENRQVGARYAKVGLMRTADTETRIPCVLAVCNRSISLSSFWIRRAIFA